MKYEDKDVVVFFVYPTCYLPEEATEPAVCDIDHEGMRQGALNTEELVPAMAEAQLNTQRGVVIATTEAAAREATIPASMEQFFGPQCYHGRDYALFYMNLRQNIADRIAAWRWRR